MEAVQDLDRAPGALDVVTDGGPALQVFQVVWLRTDLQFDEPDALAIRDAGLVHLKGLTELKSLYSGTTRVTDGGIAELKQALPKGNFVKWSTS